MQRATSARVTSDFTTSNERRMKSYASYNLKFNTYFCASYLLIHLLYFLNEIVSFFIYFFRFEFLTYVFFYHILWYCFISLIKPRIFNILNDFSFLNIFSSLLPHLLQIKERTTVSLKCMIF